MTQNPFITHLKELARREDRGALASLRRGLGQTPGTVPEMHPYVAPFLADGAWAWRHQCHYIVASLFALHPEAANDGNMGETFQRVATSAGSESIEGRFIAMLKCHRDDLFDHLRHAVSLAKSKNVPICWELLFQHVQSWDDDRGWVQREWSRSYWGVRTENEPANTKGENQ